MSKGPRVSEEVEQLITEIYVQARDDGEELVAKQVLDKLRERREELKEVRKPVFPLPGVRAAQVVLAKVRKNLSALVDQDAPWSLGASGDGNAPPEATKSLLNIWWWCRVVGRAFTIREAKWVVKFWGVLPFEELLYWASAYAKRERVSKLLEGYSAAYTDDLDAFLGLEVILTEWWNRGPLYLAAEATETVPTSGVGRLREMGKDPGQSSPEVRQRIADFINPGGDWKWLTSRPGNAVEYRLGLLYIEAEVLPTSVDAIYAMWLRKLGTGPKWPRMSQEAKQAAAERLHAEVTAWWHRREGRARDDFRGSPFRDAIEYEKAMKWYFGVDEPCRPSDELLKIVGMGQEQEGGSKP